MSPAKYDFVDDGEFFPIFSTPVGVFKDSKYEDIRDDVIKVCENERLLDPEGRSLSNRGGWQSKDDWFYKEENSFINQYIHEMAEKIFYDSYDHRGELKFKIGNSWININSENSYNITHTHSGCDFSGVFYAKVPEDFESSPLVFCNFNDGNSQKIYKMFSDSLKDKYGIFSEVNFHPSEGTMIIFPSHIPHCVEPSLSKEERISIAFNIIIMDFGKLSQCHTRGNKK